MPKGSLLKQNQPSGVRKVVRSLEAGNRGTCQNPVFVSETLGILSPLKAVLYPFALEQQPCPHTMLLIRSPWILLKFSPCDVVPPQLRRTLVVGLFLGCGWLKECHQPSAESHALLEGSQP